MDVENFTPRARANEPREGRGLVGFCSSEPLVVGYGDFAGEDRAGARRPRLPEEGHICMHVICVTRSRRDGGDGEGV